MAYQVDAVHYEVEWLAVHEVALEDERSSHLKPWQPPSTRQAVAAARGIVVKLRLRGEVRNASDGI